MAAPSYTEDLTDIDLFESGSTGVTAFNISGGGGGAPAFGADFGMQGGGCWDKAASSAERGAAINKTPGTGTVAAGVHIFQWGFVATPGVCDSLQNRGAYVLIGTSTTDFMQFHVEGNDTYGAQGRVGKCYVVDYVTTSNTGSVPYRTVNGTPGATPTYFGFGIKTTATVKGSNFGVDAARYGTGAYLTAGELISAGDASDNPCTFSGFATQNDSISNRWGILTSLGGANYELQGRFVIGQNNSGTATLCRFRDSGVNINLVDTVHSETDFTQIIIDHASTRCELTNINITALGTHNPGQLNVNSNNPTVVLTGGTFTDMGVTVLRSNTTVSGTTWRGCDTVTLNGATVDGATFDSSGEVITDDLDDITDCNFVSDGAGHAVKLTALGTGTMDWDSQATGYADNSPDGDETIWVAVGSGTLTINVAAGASTPSIRTDGATVTVAVNQVSVTVKAVTTSSAAIPDANVFLYAASSSPEGPYPAGETVTITHTAGTATVSHTGHGLSNGDKVWIQGANEEAYLGVWTISNVSANAYDYTLSASPLPSSPATGTITSTYVLLKGLTDSNGEITMTNSFASNQTVAGRVRKSTPQYIYQQSGSNDVVIEAENYYALVDQSASSPAAKRGNWEKRYDASLSSNFYMAVPLLPTGTNVADVGSYVEYKVNFATSGSYDFYVRHSGQGATNDSLFWYIVEDNANSVQESWALPSPADWEWDNANSTSQTVTGTGVKTVRIYDRERNVTVDRFVIRLTSAGVPSFSGDGPEESAKTSSLYKTSQITGEVTSTGGLSTTVLLQSDA